MFVNCFSKKRLASDRWNVERFSFVERSNVHLLILIFLPKTLEFCFHFLNCKIEIQMNSSSNESQIKTKFHKGDTEKRKENIKRF